MMERVKSHWGHIVKRKKIQGNGGKNIAGGPIMKTFEYWDTPQSAAQGKYYPNLQVIQQTGTTVCIRNSNDGSVHILLILIHCRNV